MNTTAEENVPISQRYLLTIKEGAEYFRIGEHRLRNLIDDNPNEKLSVLCGNRRLIKRERMEKFIDELDNI